MFCLENIIKLDRIFNDEEIKIIYDKKYWMGKKKNTKHIIIKNY